MRHDRGHRVSAGSFMRFLRAALAFLGAVIVAAATGSLWQTHRNIVAIETLGHEVRLETLSPEELAEECGDCRLALELFRVVYTRRKVGAVRDDAAEDEAEEEEATEQVTGNPRRSK